MQMDDLVTRVLESIHLIHGLSPCNVWMSFLSHFAAVER